MTTQSIATKSISFADYWIRLCILLAIIVSVFAYKGISDPETITCWIIIACGALHVIIMIGEPLMNLTQAEHDSIGNTTALSILLIISWVALYCEEWVHNKDILITFYFLQSILFVMFTARTWQNLDSLRLLQAIITGILLWVLISKATEKKR